MSTQTSPVKTIIIDDQQLIIDGLSALLNQSAEVQILGSTTNGQEAAQLVRATNPEVVLLDLRFKGQECDGIEIASMLLKEFKELKILTLTSFDDLASIKRCFQQGVKGYLIKNTDKEELIHAIKTVYSGQKYLSPKLADSIIGMWMIEEKPMEKLSDDLDKKDHFPLTDRELEVALLAAKGMERKQIAEQLFISNNTVGTHLTRIYAKLGIKNVAAMINWLIGKKLM